MSVRVSKAGVLMLLRREVTVYQSTRCHSLEVWNLLYFWLLLSNCTYWCTGSV